MQQKKSIQSYKNILFIFILGIFSFFINYYYGFIGMMPMDNTVLYNGGYRVLRGFVPFTDYWLVTGPLLDYLNAFFFLILGVSWKTFIIHSSIFNLFIALASYYLFIELKLSSHFSLFYAALISVLFYPVVGTPFVDHHSTFFMILGYYSFILAINKKKLLFFGIIPFIFCLSFLSKQTPAAYGLIAIIPLLLLFCFLQKKYAVKILFSLFCGSAFSILFIFLFFYFSKINIFNFINQYILYASTIGDFRISNYDFNIFKIIVEYKFIFICNSILFIVLINNLLSQKKNIEDIFTILVSITLSLVLVFHQFYTLNQNYIFFIIPFLCSIIHVFYKNLFFKNYTLIFTVLLCFFSVTKYHLRFNEHRKFNELEKVDLNKAIDAAEISQDLKGLKWITYNYRNNPKEEILNLKEIIKILSQDNSKKILITNYQFLAPVMSIYDYSPNQWHHPTVSFPVKGHKFFTDYKLFFINNIKTNNIDFIFETIEKEDTITELILSSNCLKKIRMSKMLIKFKLLKECKELK